MSDPRYIKPNRRRQSNNIDGFVSPKRPTLPVAPLTAERTQEPLSEHSVKPAIIPGMTAEPLAPQSNPPAPEATKSLLNSNIPAFSSSSQQANRSGKKPKKIRKKRSKKKIVLFILAFLVLAGIGAGGWDAWQLDHKVNHLAVGNLTASVGGAENILVAGSTNRCNLTVQNAQWGFCSQGVTGVNSDIIFIVHLVPATHTVTILSIPRDTFVPNARSGDQAFKIDAALYQGPTQLVNAVEEDFGIPIQHYAEVGFDGFVNIVNAVGGVKMDFPMPVYDSESYLDIKTPGCQLLNGDEALQVVRARHLQYDPPTLKTTDVNYWPQEVESDIARIARTHEFLRVLASTVAQKGLSNPITDQKLVDAIAPQIQVDSGLSTSAMLQLIEQLHAVNINNVPQYTLPISTTNFGNYEYDGSSFGDVVFPVEANDQQTIDQFLGISAKTSSSTGKPLPNPATVSVNVINGSGKSDQASQTVSALQNLGFTMVGTPGTAKPVSSEAQETVVYYGSSATEADAEAVAAQLTGSVILSQNSGMVTSGSDVTILTGNDLEIAGDSTASSAGSSTNDGSSTTGSGSATTPTAAEATAGLAAPSSATQALSAWDPRACTN